ncbi:hypothetical protein AB0M64_18225 [Streptomyces sp. NPDC051771]|uniref:hypothetical protein n=1 Tax=Streptomyces sp. NPDC051771 TaxID=3154847 RepID=UPI0034140CB7
MHQWAGKLDQLDPQVGEAWRIVASFDVLIARGVGLDGLLRGAAVLSGTVAGAEVRGRTTWRDPDGRPVTDTAGPPPRGSRRSHAE